MRILPVLLAACLPMASPLPAAADCAGEIAALFKGGALDPFVRPNRREVTVSRAEDGTETPLSDVIWDGPTRSVNCYGSGCAMMIGREAWMGQSFDGPWTVAPTQAPEDPEAFARAIADDMAANLSDPVCRGEVDLDGRPARHYSYRTKTNQALGFR